MDRGRPEDKIGAKFAKGDRVMVLSGERLAEIGTFSYYGETGLCWVDFKDGQTISYIEHQIKHLAK